MAIGDYRMRRRTFLKGAAATAALAACGPIGGTSSGKGELRVWTSGSPEVEVAFDKLMADYNKKQPNVKVIHESFPYEQYFQKITTSAAGGGAPDIFWMDINTAGFAKRGIMLDLGKYVSKEYLADAFPTALKEGEWNGARWALPMHEIASGVYVDKKLFAEKGITVPHTLDQAWTWEQLRAMANSLTERSGGTTTRWGIGFERGLVDWIILPYVMANGGQPLSPDLKKATGFLNSAASVEAFQWFQDLHQKDKVASTTPPPDAFPNRKIAMFDAVSTYRKALAKFPAFEYDVAPASKRKSMAVMTGGWNIGIYSKTKDPALAWDLLDYVAREKHSQWITDSGYVPALKSVAKEAAYQTYPWTLFLDEMDKASVVRPPTPEYNYCEDQWDKATADIANGAPVQATLDKTAATIDEKLKNS
jgi:ABC-type glycerol-3-phosphate transport system substrate-binding protein